jgi:hypothetical protein
MTVGPEECKRPAKFGASYVITGALKGVMNVRHELKYTELSCKNIAPLGVLCKVNVLQFPVLVLLPHVQTA